MRGKSSRGLAALAVGALMLAACGSDDNESSGAGVATPTSDAGPTTTTAGGSPSSEVAVPTTSPASSAPSSTPLPDGPIKLGAIVDLSGPNAATGGYQKMLWEVSADFINKNGGIAGHDVELVIENSQNDPAVAVAAAQEILSDGVSGFLWAGGPATQDQIIPILMKEKIPYVTVDPNFHFDKTADFPYYFSAFQNSTSYATEQVQFLKDKGISKFVVLRDGTTAADAQLPGVQAAAESLGLEVTDVVSYDNTSVDLSTPIQQAKDSGAEGMVILAQLGFDKVFASLEQAKWDPVIVTDSNALLLAGTDAVPDDIAATTFYVCGPAVASPTAKLSDKFSETMQMFADNFGGFTRTTVALPVYLDQLLIFKKAIESTGSLDGDAIKTAIEGINGESFSMPEVEYSFSPSDHFGYKLANICRYDIVSDPQQIPILADPNG